MATTLKIDFTNIQGQLTLQSRIESVSNYNSSKILWLSLLLSRMKKIRSKLKVLEWIWSKFELIPNIVVILVTCKNEEDQLKNKDARVATTQNIDFSNTQGQITPQSEIGSGQNSNSSEMFWMSLLLPRIQKIRIKLKVLQWPQH